jgi:hypothetical protein
MKLRVVFGRVHVGRHRQIDVNTLDALGARGNHRARAGIAPERVERVTIDLAMPPDVDTPEDYAKLHVQ